MEKQATDGSGSCLGCAGSAVAVVVFGFLAGALGSVFLILFLLSLVGAGICVARLFTPSAVRGERASMGDSADGMASGVTVGARGCLGTVVGCVVGALLGVGLVFWLMVPPNTDWDEDSIMWLIAFGGGCFGATLGALFGLVAGSRRR